MRFCAPQLLLSPDTPMMSRSASPAPAIHCSSPARQLPAPRPAPADRGHLSNVDDVAGTFSTNDKRPTVDGRRVVGGRFDDEMIRKHVAEHGVGNWHLLGDNQKEQSKWFVLDRLRCCTGPGACLRWFDSVSPLLVGLRRGCQ